MLRVKTLRRKGNEETKVSKTTPNFIPAASSHNFPRVFIFTVGRSLAATSTRINFLVTLSRSIPFLTRRDPIARPGFALYPNRTGYIIFIFPTLSLHKLEGYRDAVHSNIFETRFNESLSFGSLTGRVKHRLHRLYR